MLIKTNNEFNTLLEDIKSQQYIGFDTETTGLFPFLGDRICGISISFKDKRVFYIPIKNIYNSHGFSNNAVKLLYDMIISNNVTIIGHNLKFDLEMLYFENIDIFKFKIYDTLILARLCLKEKFRYGLKEIASELIDESAKSSEDILKKLMRKSKIKSYAQVPIDDMVTYASNDALYTLELFKLFQKQIVDENLQAICEIEHRLLFTLIQMELSGVKIDREYVTKCQVIETKKLDLLQKEIFSFARTEFNILSNKQLNEVMQSLKFTSPVMGKNSFSWSEEVLAQLQHPFADAILRYRTRAKLLSTYIEPFLNYTSDTNEFIHCNFRQYGTRTGRLSCVEPNLQNIPRIEEFPTRNVSLITSSDNINKMIDENDISSIRSAFIPSIGKLFFFDYSQMELRVAADYANEDVMIDAFNKDIDVHSAIAHELFKMPEDKDSAEYKYLRDTTKKIDFGILYGIGPKLLSTQINKTYDEAKAYLNKFFKRFKSLKQFIDKVAKTVETRGYIFNKFGRRYRIDAERSYTGINYLVQGSCADILKSAMVKIADYLKDKKTRMILSIHDELAFDVANDEYFEVIPKIKEIMEFSSVLNRVPLKVEVAYSSFSWGKKAEFNIDLYNLHCQQYSCSNCKLCELSVNIANSQLGHGKLIGYGFGKIFFVAQNPSYYRHKNIITPIDDVGISRQFMNTLFSLGFKSKYYYTNLVKCSTKDNIIPDIETINVCANNWLQKELKIVQPKLIVAMGKLSIDFFNGKLGEFTHYNDCDVYSIYHPSYIARNNNLKKEYIEELEKIIGVAK